MNHPLEIDVVVEAGGWPAGHENLIHGAVTRALEMAGVEQTGPAELSVLLTDDAHQQKINVQWRAMDKSTNVLSFPALEDEDEIIGLIGDLSLAYETLVRESEAQGTPFDHHFTHLIVHGLLHCLGFDHETDEEALVMEGLETKILASLDIADPYADE